MKRKCTLLAAVALALCLGTAGITRADEMDDRIETAAKKTYVFRTYLKDDAIKVQSRNGVVTLTGSVAEPGHKSLAEDTVRSLPGVTDVDNRLAVKQPETTPASDDWISAKVKAALLLHRSVSAKTQVFVTNGIVTLYGTASSQAEKDLTTEYARDVEGVKDVKNEMTVATAVATTPAPDTQTLSEKIDDASITAQVKGALLLHRSTSALRTRVETRDGIVTLSGEAGSQAEKDLVTKLTRDVDGVKEVRNEMTIKG